MAFGFSFTSRASGTVIKRVECENCSHRFRYEMDRTVEESAFSPVGLDNEGARRRAKESAERRLRRTLDRECEPIPCPECGWYQRNMVRTLKGRQFVRLTLGLVALFIIWLLPSAVAAQVPAEQMYVIDGSRFERWYIGGVSVAFTLYVFLVVRTFVKNVNADVSRRDSA